MHFIREQRHWFLAQGCDVVTGSREAWRVAGSASDPVEAVEPIAFGSGYGAARRQREEAHERGEERDVVLFTRLKVHTILGFRIEHATGKFVAFLGKDLVRNTHFDVVGLSRENRERLILRLPSEPGDGAVVVVRVESARDSQACFERGIIRQVRSQLAFGNGLDQT